MNTHSNRQTFGSTDSCFASTLADASQRTTPFNIHKVITPKSTSSLFISIHRTSTVSLKPLITSLSWSSSVADAWLDLPNAAEKKERSLAPDYRVFFFYLFFCPPSSKLSPLYISSPKLPDLFSSYLPSIFYTAQNLLPKRSSDLFFSDLRCFFQKLPQNLPCHPDPIHLSPTCHLPSSIQAAIPIPMHSSKEEPCKSMQSIMERRHTDLLDTIEPKSLGSARVQTTSFRTTN